MHVRIETDIDAPADDVWETLGTRFTEIDKWAGVVKTSRALDADEVPPELETAPDAPALGRETSTRVTLREVLTRYDNDARSLTFVGVGLPPMVSRAEDTQSVVETGTRTSKVVFEIDFDFRGPFKVFDPIMSRRMRRTFGGVQADLKGHVESRD